MTPETEVDLLMAEPTGDLAHFLVGLPGSPKTYGYAALRTGRKWYLTGSESPQGVTWAGIVSWLKRKNATIVKAQTATQLEDLL